jgi:hypothetical protein
VSWRVSSWTGSLPSFGGFGDWPGWRVAYYLQESYGDVRDSDASTLGLAFIRDGNGANAFSKLSRY